MNQIRIGVIGAGYWGPHLIRNVDQLEDARLSGIADVSAARLHALRPRYAGVFTTADYRDLLTGETDAIIIATPVRTHFVLAQDALRAGKHVLIEKPLAQTSAEAKTLIRLAERNGLVLMAGHTFEYNPAVVAVHEMVQRGDIGRVLYVDAARLNLGQFRTDVDVTWDLAPHDVSIINMILESQPTQVSARGSACIDPDTCDVAYLDLYYPSGVVGHVHVSWLDPAKVRRVTVVGDEKMIVYNDVAAEGKLRIYDKGVIKTSSSGDFADFQLDYRNGGVFIPAIPGGEPLKLEIAHFADCIRHGTVPRSDGWSGLRVTRVLEAATRSMADGGVRKKVQPVGPPRARSGVAPGPGRRHIDVVEEIAG
jgi:predicted dehydrogenase